jgi:hypothetical protein
LSFVAESRGLSYFAQARDGSHRHGLPVRRRDVRYGTN